MLKCYNTITKEYQEVEVSDEIEQEVKRSYWREKQAERRYYLRAIELNENINYKTYTRSIEDIVIIKEEVQVLQRQIDKLSDIDKCILYMSYFNGMSNAAIGRKVHLSGQYIGKKLKKIKIYLRQAVLEEYDY